MAENEEIKALEEKTEVIADAAENKTDEKVSATNPKAGINDMSDHELLVALLKEQKKASRRSLVTAVSLAVICIAICAAVLIIVPKVNSTLNNAYQAIDNIETVVANADKALGSVEKSLTGIDEMVKNVDKVVVDNTDSLGKTVERMSKIDIESLNKSIKYLGDIIAPMAKFFRR